MVEKFEVKVKITGNYVTTFDQMGLMLRIDHENWIKAGVEYVDGKQNVSAVVTHRTSDWSVVQLPDASFFMDKSSPSPGCSGDFLLPR